MTCSTPVRLQLVPALPTAPPSGAPAGGENAPPSSVDSVVSVAAVRSRTPDSRRAHLRLLGERGMATAEYAVGLIAACAFAAVLYKLVTSTAIYQLLDDLASRALSLI